MAAAKANKCPYKVLKRLKMNVNNRFTSRLVN
jgi:hypothetical protein